MDLNIIMEILKDKEKTSHSRQDIVLKAVSELTADLECSKCGF